MCTARSAGHVATSTVCGGGGRTATATASGVALAPAADAGTAYTAAPQQLVDLLYDFCRNLGTLCFKVVPLLVRLTRHDKLEQRGQATLRAADDGRRWERRRRRVRMKGPRVGGAASRAEKSAVS